MEVLVGEDCSPDGTLARALSWQSRMPDLVRVLPADSNLGFYGNYRRLLQMARGEYIAYVEGDDYWLPGKLARQIEFLLDNPAHSAVYTNAVLVDRDGSEIGVFNDVPTRSSDQVLFLRCCR
jgi:glycosyltransferase involved in cell wall biosynthesis